MGRPRKAVGISLYTRGILREYKVVRSYHDIAMAERSLFLAKANLMLEEVNNRKFKAAFCINIPLFYAIVDAFENYLKLVKVDIDKGNLIDDEVKKSYDTFRKIVYTKSGASKQRYTPRVAVLLLFAFCSGRFSKIHSAMDCGFQSAGKLRNATAHLLSEALLSAFPVKPTKDVNKVVAMENAMYTVHGWPNCVAEGDTITFRVASRAKDMVANPFVKGLKLLMIFTALGRIEEFLIKPASWSDNKMYTETEIGQALESGRYVEDLKWPRTFKWRNDGLGLEAMRPWLKMDRKIATECKNVITPFCPTYSKILNLQSLSGEKIMVNKTMQIGYSGAERMLGVFVLQAWILRHTAAETDRKYVKNIIRLFVCLWNLNLDIEDSIYYSMPKDPNGTNNNSYLGNHFQNYHDRVPPMPKQVTVPENTEDTGDNEDKETSPENILIQYYLRKAVKKGDECPKTSAQLVTPRICDFDELDVADGIYSELED